MGTFVTGTVNDPIAQRAFGATIAIDERGLIADIQPCPHPEHGQIIPGLVDAHVHVESSMLTPAAFARAAVSHGTLAAVADPHEIANVLGAEGVAWMLDAARQTPFIFGCGAPSCVPSTPFETSGAALDATATAALLRMDGITHLGEMMNVPGVLARDPGVMQKIAAARRLGKPVDGHAPGLTGEALAAYAAAGISTDHESLTPEEATEKIECGLCVQIRHGSAASGFEPFLPLVARAPHACMFCSDDKHPDDLLDGHINTLAAAAFRAGVPLPAILQAASVNPVRHYRLPMGLLQIGDPADFVIVDDFGTFQPSRVFLRGTCVYDHGVNRLPAGVASLVNRFTARPITPAQLRVRGDATRPVKVMTATDGSLVTGCVLERVQAAAGCLLAKPEADILKIVVLNRYRPEPPAVAFVRGFGIGGGALASSVAHDAHNVIAVGATDTAVAAAVDEVVAHGGGLAVASRDGAVRASLPLPIAGLISPDPAETVAARYAECNRAAARLGSRLRAPFMTLSFMALPVIPALKLTDKGLFDVSTFAFTCLQPQRESS